MKYDNELKEQILANIDKKYADFHKGLVPGVKIAGVSVPKLRSIAKAFADKEDFLENVSLDSYEAVSVACYYIGLTTKDCDLLKRRLDYILPFVDNWAVCDTFVGSLKVLKRADKSVMFDYFANLLKSESEFSVRFAIVVLMSYYLGSENATELFDLILPCQNKTYYIDMAIAWFVATAFVKAEVQTLVLLESRKLCDEVQNKSISKICDSFRVSKENKIRARQLKR